MTPAEMSLLAAEIVKQLAPMLSGGSVAISPEKYLTAHEAAQVLGVSQATIERLTAKGAIPSHKVGRCRRYLASELQAAKDAKPSKWLASKKIVPVGVTPHGTARP